MSSGLFIAHSAKAAKRFVPVLDNVFVPVLKSALKATSPPTSTRDTIGIVALENTALVCDEWRKGQKRGELIDCAGVVH